LVFRHPELVSGSMPQGRCETGWTQFVGGCEAWLLKQVQHDGCEFV
jgi:hypothetical protein